jgi:3-methyladenine DNA glycosylase/8-oxoguanine DNA glycosylase
MQRGHVAERQHPAATRTWTTDRPCPAAAILGTLRRGAGDPSFQLDADGAIWRATLTPTGPATLRIEARPGAGEVVTTAWGAGAEWALDRLPATLGADDRPDGFAPEHPVIVQAQRRHPHLRVPKTGLVYESLVPAIIEQKVTGQEAWAGWRRLLWRYGAEAPGPGADRGLRIVPAPAVLAAIPSWDWLRCGIDPARSQSLVRAARVADSLEKTVDLPGSEADRRLRSLPGVGVWTSAEVRQRAHGDADAVSFHDYHVARDIGWALTGAAVDDAELAALLEPYRPHRYRVQRLLELTGARHPRRGPRMAPRTHLPGYRRL